MMNDLYNFPGETESQKKFNTWIKCDIDELPAKHRVFNEAWSGNFRSALMNLGKDVSTGMHELIRIQTLESEFRTIKQRLKNLEENKFIIVAVDTLTPDPYIVEKPFHVVIKNEGDSYIASFYDANINASGDTEEEALANLKDILVCLYNKLNSIREDKLGNAMLKQRKILNEFIRCKNVKH